MRTIKRVPLELVYTELIPVEMEFGKIYYSEKYSIANMLCPCGCRMPTPFPIGPENWLITTVGTKFSVTPSVLQRMGCKTHFIVENGTANIV